MKDTNGKTVFSEKFEVRRGVIQGDIILPVLFILALDQIMQTADGDNKGVKCGSAVRSYITQVGLMMKRLNVIGDESSNEADMKINMDKTLTHHVYRRADIAITEPEVRKAEQKYGVGD